MSNYHIKSLEEYWHVYRKSVLNPENFWEEIAEEHFSWRKRWDKVLTWDFKKPEVAWYEGAKLNITENCLDRHLATRANKTAILFEPNDPNEEAQHITYKELHERVCRFANVLKERGIKKGDRICIYLPMIPELVVAMLACARIGAVHSVVFAGFSATALATRINDCDCTMVICSDGSYRGAKITDLKGIVDEALTDCPRIKEVLVVKRTNNEVTMVEHRDFWVQPLLDAASTTCEATVMDAEDMLFVLYTSGSTGKPKGMV
ncbi:MAG: AMP-binding protein, partial [Nonlabens sp.]|nr:AMP-binding protein [Nonlabens sp.]